MLSNASTVTAVKLESMDDTNRSFTDDEKRITMFTFTYQYHPFIVNFLQFKLFHDNEI